MRVVTLMCLALAGLAGVAASGPAVLARGISAQPATQPPAPSVPAAPAAPAQPATALPAPPASAGRSGVPASIRAAEKRRRSYASCNRESHNRNLRGGARRRFLIRCKLGYERRRPAQQSGQGPQPQPATKTNPPPQQAPAKPAQQPQPTQPTQPPAKRP